MKLEELKNHLAEYKDDAEYAPFEIGDIKKLLAVAEALKKAKAIYDLEMTFETAMAFKKCMEEDMTNSLAELEGE